MEMNMSLFRKERKQKQKDSSSLESHPSQFLKCHKLFEHFFFPMSVCRQWLSDQ